MPDYTILAGMMSPPGFDWGSMWAYMALPSVIIGVVIVFIVVLFLRQERNHLTSPLGPISSAPVSPTVTIPSNDNSQAGKAYMGEVFRSLAPTLMDDEKRVVDELARAGGEVLQSDLPRMTDFSKATVSKVIHSLEVRGIVVREKHKWTYWCKINPRLVERVRHSESTVPDDERRRLVGSSS